MNMTSQRLGIHSPLLESPFANCWLCTCDYTPDLCWARPGCPYISWRAAKWHRCGGLNRRGNTFRFIMFMCHVQRLFWTICCWGRCGCWGEDASSSTPFGNEALLATWVWAAWASEWGANPKKNVAFDKQCNLKDINHSSKKANQAKHTRKNRKSKHAIYVCISIYSNFISLMVNLLPLQVILIESTLPNSAPARLELSKQDPVEVFASYWVAAVCKLHKAAGVKGVGLVGWLVGLV